MNNIYKNIFIKNMNGYKFFMCLAAGIFLGSAYYKYKRLVHEINKGIIYFIETNTDTKFSDCELIAQDEPFSNTIQYLRLIRSVPEDIPIKLILSTNGEDVTRCDKLLRALKNHKSGYIAYIYHIYQIMHSLVVLF